MEYGSPILWVEKGRGKGRNETCEAATTNKITFERVYLIFRRLSPGKKSLMTSP